MTDYGALWNDIPMYRMKDPKDFIQMFASQKMKFTPGDKFHYNNAGFILLGLIVEQQTGMRFTEYVEKNIFLPCGMYDSGYFSLDKLPKNVAYGYIENELDGSWKTNIYSIPIIGGPDGGAFVTAPDMIKFWKSLMGGDPGVSFRSSAYLPKDIQIVVIANKEYGAYAITKEIENSILLQT